MKARLFSLAIGLLFSLNTFSQGCWDSLAPPAFVSISSDSIGYCGADTLSPETELSIQPQSYHSILWSNGDDTLSTLIDSAGEYWVTVTFDTCTWVSDTITAYQYPPINPYIVENGPIEFCQGESVVVCVEPQPFVSVAWTSGASTPCITISEPGLYCAIVMDQYGCIEMTDTCVDIIVHPLPEPVIHIFSGHDTLFCIPDSFVTYQWDLNGAPIPTATDPFFVPPVYGNYTVEVTDSFGCTNTSQIFVNEYWPDGIDETRIVENLSLYPNPVKDKLAIELKLNTAQKVSLSLTDVLGKEVKTSSLGSGSQFNSSVDLGDLKNGVYFLQVQVGDGRLTKRLVKE